MSDQNPALGATGTPPAGGTPPASGGAPTPAAPPAQGTPPAAGQPPAAAAPPPAAGAPVRYDLKLPDKNCVLDQRALDETATFARELGLSNEGAQKLLERHNLMVSQGVEATRQTQEAGYKQTTDTWISTARADAEYGGANYDANLAIAIEAMDKVATPELKALLADKNLRFGDHPEVIRLFYRLGTRMKQGSFVSGQEPGASQKEPVHMKLYGATSK